MRICRGPRRYDASQRVPVLGALRREEVSVVGHLNCKQVARPLHQNEFPHFGCIEQTPEENSPKKPIPQIVSILCRL